MQTFKEDVVVTEGLVDSGKDLFSYGLGGLQGVLAVRQDLRLDDWHNSVLLADGRVSGEDIGVLDDGQLRWHTSADLEGAPPFGEVSAVFLVLSASDAEVVQTLGGCLAVRAQELDHALVHLDAGDDAARFEQLGEGDSIVGLLVESLVEENDTGDAVGQ